MKTTIISLGSLILLVGCAAAPIDATGPLLQDGAVQADGTQEPVPDTSAAEIEPEAESSVGHALLLYLPNRLFDILDLVRARVRLGPGWTLSLRATELLDLNMGAHATAFIGLQGPRHEPVIPWPFGIETMEGMEASLADSTDEEGPNGPGYGPLEFGVGFQALIVGVDVGVPVMEIFDLVTGLFFIDLMDDDL